MRTIYLDNAATTPCDEAVARLVCEVLTRDYGNPSSLHAIGLSGERLTAAAAKQTAAAIRCLPEEIVFTSGATEANNLALLGAARARRRRGNHILTMESEHLAVIGPVKALAAEGFTPEFVPPTPEGKADPEAFAAMTKESTALVSCMLVNNETGAVNDVAAVAAAVKRKNPDALVHCDAVQALGKLPIDLRKLPVDLLSLSGHKIYGPKGVGALFVRKGVRILPLLHGGGQQRALRPGTENTPGIAGFGLACELAAKFQAQRYEHAVMLTRRFKELIGGIGEVNSPEGASPYICNVSFKGARGETMLHFLESRGIYVSSGSACARGAKSHVLKALGLPAARIDGALRFSFSHMTSAEDLEAAAAALREGLSTLARRE